MSGRIWIGLALALLATAALAAGPGAVRKQAEASMLVTGQVRIEPDGSVSGSTVTEPSTGAGSGADTGKPISMSKTAAGSPR